MIFRYNGKEPDFGEMVDDLLFAADKYGLNRLKVKKSFLFIWLFFKYFLAPLWTQIDQFFGPCKCLRIVAIGQSSFGRTAQNPRNRLHQNAFEGGLMNNNI